MSQMLLARCKKALVGLENLVSRCQQIDLTFAFSGQQFHVCSLRGQQTSGVTDKRTMDRSRTTGSPLCSLSVGEPGDPGCGAAGWNTEGETEKVTALLTLFMYCQVSCAQTK